MTTMLRPAVPVLLLFYWSQMAVPLFAVTATRGPYLQQVTTNSIVLRWRTDVAANSFVRFGLSRDSFTGLTSNVAVVTEHTVKIADLQPDTKYYYEIGTSAGWFPGSTNDFFITSSPIGIPKPTRIWALGDSGTAGAEAMAVRDAYRTYAATRQTDLWLMLGDNAYSSGTDAEYQAAVFNMYPTFLRNTVLWPTLGNHDAGSIGVNGVPPFFDIFTLPQNGEAGGIASGTEHYYSFDYANIHLICLDSMSSDRTTNGPMCAWLRSDLEATVQDWIIAYWHHPPYSKGSHDSDTETGLIEMRENVVPILESYGVDLVLSGHSHSYERSYLLDGHYGISSTFSDAMKIDGGSGREGGTGAYRKPAGRPAHQGAVYTVAGCSGKASGGSLNHPAMFISLDVLGSVVIDINNTRLDLVFLQTNALPGDYFTILKAPLATNPPAAPTGLVAIAVSENQIHLSWAGNLPDAGGFKLEHSTNAVDFVQFAVVGAAATNGLDAGLTPVSTYFYRIRAYNAVGDSPYSDIAYATTPSPGADLTPPAAVTDLRVTGVTSNSVTLSWTAPGDDGHSGTAARYDVRYSTAAIGDTNFVDAILTGGAPAPTAAGTSQSITIGGLDSDAIYYFALKTYDETNNLSPLSNAASTRTLTPGAPVPPTGLMARAVAINEIDLTWTDNSDNEDSFEIERSTNGVDFIQIAVAEVNTTDLADHGLAPDTTYYFRVRAVNAADVSPYSNIAAATTPEPPDVISDTNAPAAVTNLSIATVGTNSATLTWTAPGDDGNSGTATRYDLRYSTAAITSSTWATATLTTNPPIPLPAGSTQSMVVVGLDPGTKYYFALKTADETNNLSPLSNVPNATTKPNLPTAPSGLKAIGVATNEIDLTWTDNANNEDGFKIERSTNSADFVQITSVGPNVTNAADLSVRLGITNYYRVRAYNITGDSAYSNTNSAKAVVPIAPLLTVLIASNSVWKYLDNGSDPGAAWTAPAFNDSAWASGPAQLGYNGGHEATVVSYGPNASAKYITTYFRRHFP